MKILKSLTFGVMSRGSQNPVLARRSKLLHRLEQQKRLAQCARMAHLCHRCGDGSGSSSSSVGRSSCNSALALLSGTIVGCFCLLACRSAEWTGTQMIGEREPADQFNTL